MLDEYNTVRYGTVRYGTLRYGTVQYGTVQYSTVQYNTIRFILRRVQLILNISSFELFADNKYNTTIIQIYNISMQRLYIYIQVCIM